MSSHELPHTTEATTEAPAAPTPSALSSESLDQVSGGLGIADIDFTKIIFAGGGGGSSGGAGAYAGGGGNSFGGGSGAGSNLSGHELTHTTQQGGGRRNP
jgi:hypothetical protein